MATKQNVDLPETLHLLRLMHTDDHSSIFAFLKPGHHVTPSMYIIPHGLMPISFYQLWFLLSRRIAASMNHVVCLPQHRLNDQQVYPPY